LPVSADEQALVVRYYAMAEELNGRGAMELAVPFYRQAIALLLAERDQKQSQPLSGTELLQSSGDVEGVIAAAQQVRSSQAIITEPDLYNQLAALEEELTLDSVNEVSAALEHLHMHWVKPNAQLSALTAKTHLLKGELVEAKTCFEHAHTLAPSCLRIAMNTAAARLACGQATSALDLLRSLLNRIDELSDLGHVSTFFGNLARAELEVGTRERALDALKEQLACDSEESVDLEFWLDQADSWVANGFKAEARALLEAIKEFSGGEFQRQRLLTLLAELLEADGSYRDAALVYRELLKPEL